VLAETLSVGQAGRITARPGSEESAISGSHKAPAGRRPTRPTTSRPHHAAAKCVAEQVKVQQTRKEQQVKVQEAEMPIAERKN